MCSILTLINFNKTFRVKIGYKYTNFVVTQTIDVL